MIPATHAEFFNDVMQELWDPGGDNRHPYAVLAVASKIRGTQRVNPENAFDVLRLLGWFRILNVRRSEFDETPLFTVEFLDKSSVIIEAKDGIGSSVEVL